MRRGKRYVGDIGRRLEGREKFSTSFASWKGREGKKEAENWGEAESLVNRGEMRSTLGSLKDC